MTLEAAIAHYGLWALGLGAGLEGETVVILGGVLVHRGALSFAPAIAAAAAGSFVADQIFFALGRRFRGHRLVRRTQQRPAFRKALRAFDANPTLFVFAFRFLYGLRTVSPVAIGTTGLSARRFVAINAAAAIAWGTAFITLGYLFGHTIEVLLGRIRSVAHVLLPVACAAAAVALGVYLIRRGRKARRAD